MSVDARTPELLEWRRHFPILERKTYLNSCSLGALSLRSESYLADFTERWHEMGASAWYRHWLGRVEALRERVARFHGSPTEAMALLPSTSAALSVISEALPADPGRNRVVTTELDFPTLVYQWRAKPDIEVVLLRSEDGVGIDLEQFRAAVDDRTLLVATSHVYFMTGYVQEMEQLARLAHEAGALLVVDGYQGAGQVPFSLADTSVDVYTSGPLKWLCGGPGLAYLYVRPDHIQSWEPRITSWFAVDDQFDFDVEVLRRRSDARRFELGTPSLPTVHTALGGQEIIDEVGIDTISERNRALSQRLIDRCRSAGLSLRLPDEAHRSAIIMIRHDDPSGAVRHLASQGIIVDHRPGYVRVSPHFYNTESEVDRVVDELVAFEAAADSGAV